MTDIIERLRAWPFESGNPINAETSFALIAEACAEIDRLRAQTAWKTIESAPAKVFQITHT